jgi:hypothetical protein
MPKKVNNKKSNKNKNKNSNSNKNSNKNIINIKIGGGKKGGSGKKPRQETPIIYNNVSQPTNRTQYLDTNTLSQQEQQYKILSEINKIKQDNEIRKLTTHLQPNNNFSSQYPEPVSSSTFTSQEPERTYIKYFDDKLKEFLKPNEEVNQINTHDDDDTFFDTIEQGSYLQPPDLNKINNLSSLHIPKSNIFNNEPSPLSPTSAALFNMDEGEMKFEHHEPTTGSSNFMMNQDEIKQPINKGFNKPKQIKIDYDYDYNSDIDETPLKFKDQQFNKNLLFTTPAKTKYVNTDDLQMEYFNNPILFQSQEPKTTDLNKNIDTINNTIEKQVQKINNLMKSDEMLIQRIENQDMKKEELISRNNNKLIFYKKDIDNTPLINLDNRELRSGTTNIMIDHEPSTGAAHIMMDQEPEITGISILTDEPFEQPDILVENDEFNAPIKTDKSDIPIDESSSKYTPTEKLNTRLKILKYLKMNENKDPGDRVNDDIIKAFNKINERKNTTGSGGAVGTMTFKLLRNKINMTPQNIINQVLELGKLNEEEIEDIIIKEKNEVMKKVEEKKAKKKEKMQDKYFELIDLVNNNYTHGNSNLKADSIELKLYNDLKLNTYKTKIAKEIKKVKVSTVKTFLDELFNES